MTALIIISLLFTASYIGYTVKLFGIPYSISDTYYLLENKKPESGILFTLWTWVTAFPLIVAWIVLSEGMWYQFLSFFAFGALLFVGTAAQFKKELTKTIHYVSAGICLLAATTWVILSGYWHIAAISYTVAGVIIYRYKKPVFWIEVAAFVMTYVTLLAI